MPAKKLSLHAGVDEKMLLCKIVNGDYKAFTKLYEMYIAEVTNYASKFTNDIQIIEDCIHDIFVLLWNNRLQLEITYSFKAYLFKCVRTSIIRKIEKHKKTVFIEEAEEEVLSFFMSDEEKYIDAESYTLLREKMSNILSLLTFKQKEVIYLRFYQGLSFDEIAINMNLTTKACYKLMGRAISELRKTCSHSFNTYYLSFLFLLLNLL